MANQARQRGESSVSDRLALSRAQHLQSRDHRIKSVSEDEEIDAISDWSESDRECCPLTDFELASNIDGTNPEHPYDIPFDDYDDDIREKLPMPCSLLEHVLHIHATPLATINDSITSTRLSFSSDMDKSKLTNTSQTSTRKPASPPRKLPQAPLLPARRIQSKPVSTHRPLPNVPVLATSTGSSRQRSRLPSSPTRIYLRREATSTSTVLNMSIRKDSCVSINSSCPSNDEIHRHQTASARPSDGLAYSQSYIGRQWARSTCLWVEKGLCRWLRLRPSNGCLHPEDGSCAKSTEMGHHCSSALSLGLSADTIGTAHAYCRTSGQSGSRSGSTHTRTNAIETLSLCRRNRCFSKLNQIVFLRTNPFSFADQSLDEIQTHSFLRSLLSRPTFAKTCEIVQQFTEDQPELEKCRYLRLKDISFELQNCSVNREDSIKILIVSSCRLFFVLLYFVFFLVQQTQ